MNMPFCDGYRLIEYAFEKETDEKIFMRWIPYQNAVSFDEFKQSLIKPKQKSEKAILEDVNSIILANYNENKRG